MAEKQSHVQDPSREEDEKQYPPLKVVLPAMLAVYLAVFLVALDRTIVGTATPTITKQFDSFGDLSWYESGYLLPFCVLQLTFGRVYKYYSTKWVLTSLVAIFEIGSIVCASAPSSKALIVGRAIQGMGAGGIASGTYLLIKLLVPLQARPTWTGGLGGVFGIASILGPILGGYLTSITWRWCFWVNVPIGAISLVLLILLTPKSEPPAQRAKTWSSKINQLDPLGFILIAPTVICLLFAIQWGGVKFPWDDGRIIAMFVIAGIFGLAFVGSQLWRQEDATVPPRIFCQRSILAGSFAQIGIGSVLVLLAFYLPIWFQVVQDKSPQNSGLSLLPLLLSNVFAVVGGGIATSLLGYYTPFMIAGGAICIAGSALISTWQVDVVAGKWIGYQIVVGVGLGFTLQGPNIAAQTVLSDSDVSIALSLLNFVSILAGTIFVTVAQSLLSNKLIGGLEDIIPGFDPTMVTDGSATTLRNHVPTEQLPAVLDLYNESIKSVWYLTLGLSCLILLASLWMEWRSVKTPTGKDDGDQA